MTGPDQPVDPAAADMDDLLGRLQTSVDNARAQSADRPARPRRTGRPPLTDRRTLLDAARQIGYPNLTVGAVTGAVGVKYSTFYRHFPTLDSLTLACVEDDLIDVPWPDAHAAGSARSHLRGLGYTLVSLLEQRPGIDVAFLRIAQIAAHGPDWHTPRGSSPVDRNAHVTDHLVHSLPARLARAAEDAVELLVLEGSHMASAWDDVAALICLATHAGPTLTVRRRAFVDLAVAAPHR